MQSHPGEVAMTSWLVNAETQRISPDCAGGKRRANVAHLVGPPEIVFARSYPARKWPLGSLNTSCRNILSKAASQLGVCSVPRTASVSSDSRPARGADQAGRGGVMSTSEQADAASIAPALNQMEGA